MLSAQRGLGISPWQVLQSTSQLESPSPPPFALESLWWNSALALVRVALQRAACVWLIRLHSQRLPARASARSLVASEKAMILITLLRRSGCLRTQDNLPDCGRAYRDEGTGRQPAAHRIAVALPILRSLLMLLAAWANTGSPSLVDGTPSRDAVLRAT
jgi:hypothetical protein